MKIEQYYKLLEDQYKLNDVKLICDDIKINEEDAHLFALEQMLLNPYLNSKSPIPCSKQDFLNYCKQRVLQVDNIQLKLKYHKDLLIFNCVDKTLLNDYVISLKEALLEVENKKLYSYSEAKYAFKALLEVLLKYKLDVATYKNKLLADIRSKNVDLHNKIWKINIAVEVKFLKSNDLKGIPQILLEQVDNLSNNKQAIGYLQSIIGISKRAGEHDVEKLAFEQLSDRYFQLLIPLDDDNIMASHMNAHTLLEIISCYQKAQVIDKKNRALQLYDEMKSHHKFVQIPIHMKQEYVVDLCNKIKWTVDNVIMNKSSLYVYAILVGDLLQFPCLSLLSEFADKSIAKNFCYREMIMVRSDGFNNVRKIDTKVCLIHRNFDLFYKQVGFNYIIQLIDKAMKNDLFDFEILKENLESDGFMHTYQINKGGLTFETSFFEKVGAGLEMFLLCHKDFMQQKIVDWRFCVDFLTTKFEGLIRNVIALLGKTVTNVNTKNGTISSSVMLLDQLLAQKVLLEVFDEDDILLFKQTFTNDGYNIRNDVAHGLLLPQEYTATKAMLVFLSILRFAKVTRKIFIERSLG